MLEIMQNVKEITDIGFSTKGTSWQSVPKIEIGHFGNSVHKIPSKPRNYKSSCITQSKHEKHQKSKK